MSPEFTDDDIGKKVINEHGDKVGIVADVEHGTAHVEPDPGITDTIKAALGWGDTGEDTYPLQEEAVDRVTADEIRLESDLAGTGSSMGTGRTGTTETTEMGGTDTGVGTDRDTGVGRDEEGRMRDESGSTRDDEGLIGDDNEGMMSDDERRRNDDDQLIGGDDDSGLTSHDDDDELLGDDDDEDRRRDTR